MIKIGKVQIDSRKKNIYSNVGQYDTVQTCKFNRKALKKYTKQK